MTELVVCLSTGKGTWGPVIKLINNDSFEKVFIITNSFGKENFDAPEKAELIVLERDIDESQMRDKIKQELEGKLSGDIALNMTSGSGREHMALFSAMVQLGVGIRLVVLSDDGFEEV